MGRTVKERLGRGVYSAIGLTGGAPIDFGNYCDLNHSIGVRKMN